VVAHHPPANERKVEQKKERTEKERTEKERTEKRKNESGQCGQTGQHSPPPEQ